SAERRMQCERATHRAGTLDLLHLRGRDVLEQQTSPGRVDQVLRPIDDGSARALPELLAHAQRTEQLLLRRHHLRCVDLEQRLSAPYGLTRKVHVQLLDEATELR